MLIGISNTRLFLAMLIDILQCSYRHFSMLIDISDAHWCFVMLLDISNAG